MFVPVALLTDITVEVVLVLSLALLMVQLPVLAVTQLATPPGTKLPLTVTLGTNAKEVRSRIVTVAYARQPEFCFADLPVRDCTAICCVAGCVGAPAASEKTSRFGEPVPTAEILFAVALVVRKDATAEGDAAGFAASARAATPVTWGVAMEVPLMVLLAVLLVYQADVMEEPGAKMSRHVP